MKTLCVFCGSSLGFKPEFSELAQNLGLRMAKRRIKLVYGGAKVGLMGVLADAVLEYGGIVTGVIPEFLIKAEVVHSSLTEIIVVDTMHERKETMYRLSDGFVAIPGGFGTLDEVIEVVTWRLLGLHKKPVAMLSHNHYWETFSALIEHVVKQGFAMREARELFTIHDDVDQAIDIIK